MISACFLYILLNLSSGSTIYQNTQNVSLPLGTAMMLPLSPNMTVRLMLKDPPDINDQFWSFEAHSFNSNDQLTLTKTEKPAAKNESDVQEDVILVENHPGLILLRSDLANGTQPFAFLSNIGLDQQNVTALVVIRNYTAKYPVPGLTDAGLHSKKELLRLKVWFYTDLQSPLNFKHLVCSAFA